MFATARKKRFLTLPKQSVQFEISRQHFTVRLAHTRRDKMQALALRYQVFHREFIGKQFPIGIDKDRYDKDAELLVLVDNRIHRVVGCYRLICSDITDQFYSASEFDLSGFLKLSGVKLELSRACVHKNYRSGTAIHLLWRGIAKYMELTSARYLFGCSSVLTTDISTLHALYSDLIRKNALNDSLAVFAREEFRIDHFQVWLERFRNQPAPAAETQLPIPPLMRSYLKAGALIAAEPALDRKYNCIDFFTVMDLNGLSQVYEKKYAGK
ncbi:MAG: GNAT family N-acetyltransferase [Bdellovibrionales bacterium]|nr:GNAT family N-acetyltransferase [Bdellovibrionales bacterium]